MSPGPVDQDPAEVLRREVFRRRRKLGLSQTKLAELAGVSRGAIVHLEASHGGVGLRTLIGLRTALRCSLDDLLPPASFL